jgi:hypothetical protein
MRRLGSMPACSASGFSSTGPLSTKDPIAKGADRPGDPLGEALQPPAQEGVVVLVEAVRVNAWADRHAESAGPVPAGPRGRPGAAPGRVPGLRVAAHLGGPAG